MRLLTLLLALCLTACAQSTAEPSQHAAPLKTIALTFDDAPRGDGPMFSGQERGRVLIDALRSVEAGPVAFFIHTQRLEQPGTRQRIENYAQAGHLIANHSHEHPWLMRTDTDEYIDGIDKAEALLAGFSNRRAWFRFPFLDEGTPVEKRDAVRRALKHRGLRNGYVTVDNYDWHIERKWQKAQRAGRSVNLDALQGAYVDMLVGAVTYYDNIAVETLGRSPAHVLLLHENDLAALFIDDLVIALRQQGWTIISPDEAYADPIAAIIPQTLMARQGHIGALAVEAGLDPRMLSHLAIDERLIDAMLDERGVFGPPEPE